MVAGVVVGGDNFSLKYDRSMALIRAIVSLPLFVVCISEVCPVICLGQTQEHETPVQHSFATPYQPAGPNLPSAPVQKSTLPPPASSSPAKPPIAVENAYAKAHAELFTRGPVHEAFARPASLGRNLGVTVKKQPTEPLNELPPVSRPPIG